MQVLLYNDDYTVAKTYLNPTALRILAILSKCNRVKEGDSDEDKDLLANPKGLFWDFPVSPETRQNTSR